MVRTAQEYTLALQQICGWDQILWAGFENVAGTSATKKVDVEPYLHKFYYHHMEISYAKVG